MPHRPSAVRDDRNGSRTEASDSEVEARVATGNLRRRVRGYENRRLPVARRGTAASMSGACGRSTRSGSPATVLWWPLRRMPSQSPTLAISLPNWRTFSTCLSKSPSCSWSRKAGSRQTVSGLYLYCGGSFRTRQQQLLARQALLDQAGASAGIPPGNVSDELRAAIILFASLLDEQQRCLYAGLESLQLAKHQAEVERNPTSSQPFRWTAGLDGAKFLGRLRLGFTVPR
jgi:hypothetical protein